MKKRILSLVLATVMICAMAVPVSAASRIDYNIAYGNCEFNTYTYCYPNSYSCLAEYNYSTDDATNYSFQIKTLATFNQRVEGQLAEFVESPYSGIVTSINRSFDDAVVIKIVPAYYVNSVFVYEFNLNAS